MTTVKQVQLLVKLNIQEPGPLIQYEPSFRYIDWTDKQFADYIMGELSNEFNYDIDVEVKAIADAKQFNQEQFDYLLSVISTQDALYLVRNLLSGRKFMHTQQCKMQRHKDCAFVRSCVCGCHLRNTNTNLSKTEK